MPLLLLLLLAAAAAEPTGQEALRGRSGGGGVKLCGREFIRAVIYTCGGSRWKRLSQEPLLGGGAGAEFLQSNSDKGMENLKLQLDLDPELEQLQDIGQLIGQRPLQLLFNFHGTYNAYVPTSENLIEYSHQIENAVQQSRGGPGLAKLLKSNHIPWVNSPRRKRGYSMGVAEICCKWGCTKTEVGRLC
ncbi:relaxin-3-like [Paroedura picta]|uniref:relaxin-3-like n=1 Tax=Paroedura picta TaxID=143630 RepID=UPI004055F9D7